MSRLATPASPEALPSDLVDDYLLVIRERYSITFEGLVSHNAPAPQEQLDAITSLWDMLGVPESLWLDELAFIVEPDLFTYILNRCNVVHATFAQFEDSMASAFLR